MGYGGQEKESNMGRPANKRIKGHDPRTYNPLYERRMVIREKASEFYQSSEHRAREAKAANPRLQEKRVKGGSTKSLTVEYSREEAMR